MSINAKITFTCDECNKTKVHDAEQHYCEDCFSGLEAQIEDLNNRVGELLSEIDDLKTELEKGDK